MYCVRWQPNAYLGIENVRLAPGYSTVVTSVQPGTPAEQAGLLSGDRIVTFNGQDLDTLEPFYDAIGSGKPGDVVTMSVARPGVTTPVVLHAALQPWPRTRRTSLAETLAFEIVGAFPVWFLLVSLPVLFLRFEDRNAWLLALLFSSFIAAAPLFLFEFIIPPALRGFALAYKVILFGLFPALFNYFFAVFPASSGLDRRFPRLKTVLLGGVAVIALPLGLWVLFAGNSAPAFRFELWSLRHAPVHWLFMVYTFGPFLLGLVSLVSNGFFSPSAEVRRKIRVIVWGTVVGFLPGMAMQTAIVFTGKQVPEIFPLWIWAPLAFGSFYLFPLSFAYAVVKHRVLEIPVLLKRSARYFLVQRGFVLLHVLLSWALAVVLALVLSRTFKSSSQFVLPVVLTAAVIFGSVLALSGMRVHQAVTQRIDRAFFRGAYDARIILQDLAGKTRTATSRHELAELLERHLDAALHPKSLAIYVEASDTKLASQCGKIPVGLETLDVSLSVLAAVTSHGKSWDVPPNGARSATALAALASLQPDCLVPILSRDGRLMGLIVLGPRLSEEPYSGDDKRLLDSVASQAGMALESVRLAEKMAERMEAERRAAIEMKVAKEVQDRLLPQSAPVLQTLECAARCIQTRSVGGDYYDFLELAPQHVGLVLGDVSGKGISAALLMANLQANLRSRCAVPSGDIALQLSGVNDQLRKSSADGYYATLFFADYDDTTRRLLYSNCGHNPPVLLRADGTIERLTATATVLGLFEKWQCLTRETTLHPGDLLAIYSDGVTEAMNRADEQFGEDRFIASLRESRSFAPALLLTNVVSTVREFTGGFQSDDLTLVVARAI
jgi:phosphoserine phosphatase RsbU/P